MPQTITDKLVRTGRPDPNRRLYYFDSVQRGLVLVVEPTGHKSFKYYYRHAGKARWFTIAAANEISLKAAREFAAELALRHLKGEDVQATKKAARQQAAPATVHDIWCAFEKANPSRVKPTSMATYRKLYTKHIRPSLGERVAGELKVSDWQAWADALATHRPGSIGPALALASALMGYAARRDGYGVARNPIRDVKVKRAPAKTKTPLTHDELRRLWRALPQAGEIDAAMVLFALLTGQRHDEIRSLRWEHLSNDFSWWTQPKNKDSKVHTVFLAMPLREALEHLPRRTDGAVFGRATSRQAINRLREAADIPRLTMHLLRHTVATEMSRLGVPDTHISKILNHAEGGITATYRHHAFNQEKKLALESWADELWRIIGI